ncbi:hypothetical protein TrVFT333_006213 [Trichoderma virens FT-333]|nr:hypothetical protein TrVFT333_006213 [Trichoderma virens FT-333]
MADQLDEEESSKRVLVAKKMLKTMGFHEEMLRSIVTSWLVPQFRPEITSELGQSLTRIQDVGFLGISNNSSEGLRPYRMFDIADRMLVDNIDPSAPYCMVSHRWKDPEINLDLLRKARQDVAESYPVWYNPDRNDVEIILKYCKEKVKQQRKDVNGCAVRNRLDEKLSQKGCYVLSLLGMYHQSRKVHAEVREAHANLEKIVRDQKVTEMENRVFRDLNNKAKFAGGTNANGTSTVDADYYDHTTNNPDENHEFIKAAYDRVFDADWERDKQSDNIKFDALSRDLRETVEGMIRCLRLWRSAIKIEQSILRAGEIFDRGLLPGQKQQTSYVWLDTCCIDKSNHNEYSESMSLMGDWYAQSAFTLVHLDTGFDKSPKGSDAEIYWQEFLHTDGDHEKLASIPDRELDQVQSYRDIDNEPEVEWSTRGWTLQELVMSKMTYYVNADWQFLHRPVENLGRAYHLIPYIDLYTEPLEVKPTPNSWKPEVLMTALLNLGAVIQSDALKVVYPRIEKESEDVEIDDSQSLSNRLLTSIAMPWNLMDTVFHVVKPEPTKSDVLRDKSSRDALLHEISVLWDPELAARFPQIEVNEKDRAKQKLFMVPENAFPQNSPDAEERVLHALSIIKALELVGFCFPKDLSRETAKSELAQAVFFAAVGLIECYDETRYPIIVQRMLRSEIDGNKPSDAQEKELLRLKREAEKRVKLEMRKKLFQELLNSFPEAKEHCAIDEMQNTEEKEEALSKTLAYILHVLVDLVKPLIQEDRQYIADFGNITLLDSWIEGTQRYGFTTQEVMTLACERKTTKSFDRAYSLMGILGVRFPTFSAEGYEKALCRLLDETITIHNDVSIFNWTGYNKGSSMRGRSMYPSTQEAYKAKGGKLHSRNSFSEVEEDKMLRTTSAYHAVVALLRDIIDFLKKNTPSKQEVEWIQDIAKIVKNFKLDKFKIPAVDHAKTEKLRSHASIHSRAEAVPFEIEIISKFIGYIIHPSARPASNQNVELQSVMMRNLTSQISINPNPEPESAMPTRVSRDDTEPVEQPVSPITNQDLAPADDDISAVAPTEVPLPAGDVDDESLPTGRKSRFVEQLSEAGRTPAASMIDSQGKSQNGDEAVNPDDDITRYLQNWATKLCDGTKVDENALKEQLPGKIQGIKYKIEEQQQQQENLINKMSYFGSSNMVSPHPIIVTNAGIEGIFDVQRVIITMADIDGLRQQVAHTTSTEQVISGYCSISTGFAQVIVRFSCKSGLLRKQLEVIDGIDFSVIKEKSKKVDKKREHKTTSKVLWDKLKRDKKNRDDKDGDKKKKKKKKDKDEANNSTESDLLVSESLDDADNKNETENEVSEDQQIRDTDEEETINRMIKFIQEDDLRLVAGEWVLARCSGVADANWFLCHLELGSTHPFYGYRIPTSEIDFENCIPEDGLVLAWNQYMNRKKEEMCKILTILLKSKERKLKRRRLVGRILRDLAPLDEKAEEEYEDNRQNLVDKIDTNGGQNNHTQNEYDYLDEYAQDRSEGARELRPSSELHSQDSAMSVPQDDMWSAPLDPQSQFTASSFETQYVLPNQELRPEDSVSNIGDQDSRPSQQPPTLRGSTAASKEGEDEDEKSHFWDYLPFIEKVAETKAKHFDKHLSATALKNTPPVLRQAIENLNDNRDFLPAMFHSAKKIHMF